MQGLKKFIAAFILSSISGISFAQDTISWRSDCKLKWVDFQGKPDSSLLYKAVSAPEIKYTLSYSNSSFDANVTCIFYKKKSWSLGTGQNLLLHEQGHFDIAELFARKLRQAFKKYIFNPKTIENDFANIFSKITTQRTKMDALYDKETNLSRSPKQIYWNKKILAELKKMDAYRI